ncbi:MAG: hypothetical protein RL685_6849 [Pseudomonadota bacterium]|jgi:predicted DNA-binding protein
MALVQLSVKLKIYNVSHTVYGANVSAATQQTAFRLPTELLARLDAYAARLRFEQPGVNVTRADAVRLLLTRALDEIEKTAPLQSGLRKKR